MNHSADVDIFLERDGQRIPCRRATPSYVEAETATMLCTGPALLVVDVDGHRHESRVTVRRVEGERIYC